MNNNYYSHPQNQLDLFLRMQRLQELINPEENNNKNIETDKIISDNDLWDMLQN